MIKNAVIYAAVIGSSVALVSSAVAQANPATPPAMIESSAAQLCGTVDRNPTSDGVIAGLGSLENRGLDEMDGALVLLTSVHHVCPQHQDLIMGAMYPLAAAEICGRPA